MTEETRELIEKQELKGEVLQKVIEENQRLKKENNHKKLLNLWQRINAVMEEVSYIKKDVKISFGKTSYTATSHDAVMGAVRPALVRYGIVLKSDVVEVNKQVLGSANKVDVIVEITAINADDPSEREVFKTIGCGLDMQDKAEGKAMSYAIKYGILKLFCLEAGEHDESRIETANKKESIKNSIINYIIEKGDFQGKSLNEVGLNVLYERAKNDKEKNIQTFSDNDLVKIREFYKLNNKNGGK